MAWAREDITRRLGLSGGSRQDASAPVTLTGAATDPKTGLIVSLTSTTAFDANNNPSAIGIDYWRHMPFGDSQKQNLIRISLVQADKPGEVELGEVWLQSRKIFDRARGDSLDDTATQQNVNRVIGAVARLNGLLRDNGPVEDTAKILVTETHLDKVAGEGLVIRGLDVKGGFAPLYLREIFKKVADKKKTPNAVKPALEFRQTDLNNLKTVMGFRINTMEPDKNHAGNRRTSDVDADSGVGFEAGVRLNESPDKLDMEIYIEPEAIPPGLDPKAIPDLIKFSFAKKSEDTWTLKDALFLGQKIDPADTDAVINLIGMAQASNRDFARHKYPAFMDSTAEFDMMDLIDPLTPPPSLEEKGGEMLYVSLHGAGHEKKIENFGDQIGIAALFLHRGTKADGSISTVGLAIDYPFASGGADSGWDGAIPDHLAFLKHIKAFAITHDHYDHAGGLAYAARMELMKGKVVYCEDRVKRSLEESMNNMNVPREMRPKIITVNKEGGTPILDDDGNVRFWLQYSPNAIKHSALVTPYIVTGCYNDKSYNGSAMVYGDSRGIREKNISFFQNGTRALPAIAAERGRTVTAAKVDRDITLVLHDVTAVRNEGFSPDPADTEKNLAIVADWFDDKGIIMDPISTNHAEYVAGLNVAHKTGRNVTGVGANAERRLSSLNMYGVDPDLDLRAVRIDPLDDGKKPEGERLIPKKVMDQYISFLSLKENIIENLDLDSDESKWTEAERATYEQKIESAHNRNIKNYMEKLPPDEREHEGTTSTYMLKSLMKYGTVRFEDDINGRFMWQAINDRRDFACLRATRGSELAKGWRDHPEKLMIYVTGTQGNAEEKFSTLRKFQDYFSLLDADPKVRSTGYKIEAEQYVAVVTQPSIPGNEASQQRMIRDLVRSRNITVVGAFMNGFTVYNPKEKRDTILRDLKSRGWNHEMDSDGNIRVYSKPIHVHGHGFKQDLLNVAKTIKAEVNTAHHIPDADSYSLFRDLMGKNNITCSKAEPDDFKVFRIKAQEQETDKKFSLVAQLNPSYILVRMIRKYGQFFGGALEFARTTMLRRDGQNRADGLNAGSASDGVYKKSTAQVAWESISNPSKYSSSLEAQRRDRKISPSPVDRRPEQRPNNRPMLDYPAGGSA